MKLKNYVISLTTATDRREHIAQEFSKQNIPYEFFDAVTIDTLVEYCDALNLPKIIATNKLSNSEKGCFISHVALWQKMLDDDLDVIAIFEDDVHLGEQAEQFLINSDWLDDAFGLIKIEHFAHEVALQPAIKTIHGRKIQPLRSGNLGTAGYIITKNTAKNLLVLLKNKSADDIIAIDHFMFQETIVNQQILVHQLNPALCIQSDRLDPSTALQSNISRERRQRMNKEKQNRTLMQKVKREISRLFGKISQSSTQTQKMEFK